MVEGVPPVTAYSDDGYLIGPYGEEVGYCNACGEERAVTDECCEDGEIFPPTPDPTTEAEQETQ